MNQKQDPRDVALAKFMLIAPLLEPGLEKAEIRDRRQEIIINYSRTHFGTISEPTIRRYLKSYREKGFEGLYPKQRADKGRPRVLTEDIMDAAAILKQELPGRSIRQIIEILEGEGRVKPGQLKTSHRSPTYCQAWVDEAVQTAVKRNAAVSERIPEPIMASGSKIWTIFAEPEESQERKTNILIGIYR